MDDDTVLFVFGDHGMTETGDHGGDSDDELGAALFVYGKSEIHREKQNAVHTAAQVSIAPTLALLMDVPVPYSNLGALLPQLFTNPDVRLQAARVNVHQVMRYAETYLRNFHDAVLAERISPLLKVFNGLDSEELTVEKSVEMIHRVGAIFQDGWAKYHVGWMLLGILALFENLLSSLVMIRNQRHWSSGRVILLKATSMCLSVWATLARNESIPPVVGITLGIQMTMHVHCLLTDLLTSDRLCSLTDLLSLLLVLVHAALVFSNSYIVHEQVVAQHFMTAYFVLLVFSSMRSRVKADRTLWASRRRRSRVTWFAALKKPSISSALSLLGALLLLRCGVLFYRCREEIMNCVMPVFLLPFGSLLESDQRLIRSSSAAFGLFMLYWLPYVFGRFVGLFPNNGLRAFLLRCCLRCVSMCTFFSWSYSWLVELYPKLMDTSVKLFFPRVFYASILMFFFIYLFDPCFVRAVATGKRNDLLLLPKIEQNIISNLRCKVQIDPCYSHVTLSLFGGRCAMVSSLALLLWMLILTMAMLLGDGLSLSVACFVLLIGFMLGHNYADSASISKTILLAEIANYYFYAFGHHATFTAIPWDAAFIGIPGNQGNMWLQAALVVVNISASHILACFVLPLMACWKPRSNDKRPVSTLFQTGLQQASANVFHYSMLFLSIMGVRLLFCTAACAMHRRHLMTWKIFAPKFIFEGVLFLVVCCCLIVQYALTLYVRNRLLRLFDFCCSDIMRIRFY